MSKSDDALAADFAASLDALRTDVTKLIQAMEQLGQSHAHAAGQRVNSAVSNATDAISGATTGAKDRVRSASAEMEACIERNPITALLIAFGVGLSVSMLNRPRV